MRFTFKYILSLLIILQFSNCKKDEESTVLVNASVANSAEGSVSFNSGDYVAGTTVTFTATPRDGYVFTNWTNTSTNQIFTTNPLSIKVNENTNLVANFEKAAYNVMFTISGEGMSKRGNRWRWIYPRKQSSVYCYPMIIIRFFIGIMTLGILIIPKL